MHRDLPQQSLIGSQCSKTMIDPVALQDIFKRETHDAAQTIGKREDKGWQRGFATFLGAQGSGTAEKG